MSRENINYKTSEDIAKLRISGKMLTECLYELYNITKPGIKLIDLEIYISSKLSKYPDYKWSFLGYNGFPTNLCLSVNDCLVHGVPNQYILKEGDLLKIDMWITYQKMITDAAISVIVGGKNTNAKAHKLAKITKNVLDKSLSKIKTWVSLYEYWWYVESLVKSRWAMVVKTLTWHGVWYKVHENPYILNHWDTKYKSIKFRPWMVLALEPILSYNSDDYIQMTGNTWPMYTKNWDLWSQREYTILVSDNGVEILAGVTEDLWL